MCGETMFLKFYFILFTIATIQCQSILEQEAKPKLCNFFDTINITGGFIGSDESITYNGIRFDKENYEPFTYTYLVNQSKISVPEYKRGCVCKFTNCVRLCCPSRYSFNSNVLGDVVQYTCMQNNDVPDINMNHLSNITFVDGMPCKIGYKLLPPKQYFDDWRVLSNGSLIIGERDNPYVVDRDGYCLGQELSEIDASRVRTKVMICTLVTDVGASPTLEQLIASAIMVVTIVFLVLTLSVYVWIPELRTLHGKIFMCYLITWIIGYSALGFGRISNQKWPTACLIVAEIRHTSFIGGFIWLSIIGYDIWRAVGRADQRNNQFLKYCLFACGITFLIVLITNILDSDNLLPENFRPGFGTVGCWLKVRGPAYVLYLYAVVMLIMVINTVFFLLTKQKIDKTQTLLNYATRSEGSKKFSNEETDADRIQLFFRLAVAMGLPWVFLIIAWLLTIVTSYGTIMFKIITMVNRLIGPVIFFLCISKPRVKRLIGKKWSTLRANGFGSSSAQTQNTVL